MAKRPYLFAQPYDTSASGFGFSTEQEFFDAYNARKPVEEYEVDFIDGDENALAVYNMLRRTGFDYIAYFHILEVLEDDYEPDEQRLARALAEAEKFDPARLSTADDFREQMDDFIDAGWRVEDGSIEDVLISNYSPGSIPLDEMEMYFDWESYARTVEINGGAIEIDRATTLVTPRFPYY